MRKATLNFVVEIVTALVLLTLIATGFTMEFRLPPGSGGRGGGMALTQWGLDRHEWGAIHFYLSLAFVGLLIAHLFLHWRWIWGMARGRDLRRARGRTVALVGALAIFLLFLVLPWLIPVHVDSSRGTRLRQNSVIGGDEKADAAEVSTRGIGEEFLQGRMTFEEVALETGLAHEELIRRLGLPPNTPPTERLRTARCVRKA